MLDCPLHATTLASKTRVAAGPFLRLSLGIYSNFGQSDQSARIAARMVANDIRHIGAPCVSGILGRDSTSARTSRRDVLRNRRCGRSALAYVLRLNQTFERFGCRHMHG